jgi:hypothetical protein
MNRACTGGDFWLRYSGLFPYQKTIIGGISAALAGGATSLGAVLWCDCRGRGVYLHPKNFKKSKPMIGNGTFTLKKANQ